MEQISILPGWATKEMMQASPQLSARDLATIVQKSHLLQDARLGHYMTSSLNPQAKPKTPDIRVTQPQAKPLAALASRPCYRCIYYMASVGIRRAFWTTEDGTWESAKVGDLMDGLNKMALGKPADIDTALNSVFVTKHEVSMLRRALGSSQ
jgi:hypothetical protein